MAFNILDDVYIDRNCRFKFNCTSGAEYTIKCENVEGSEEEFSETLATFIVEGSNSAGEVSGDVIIPASSPYDGYYSYYKWNSSAGSNPTKKSILSQISVGYYTSSSSGYSMYAAGIPFTVPFECEKIVFQMNWTINGGVAFASKVVLASEAMRGLEKMEAVTSRGSCSTVGSSRGSLTSTITCTNPNKYLPSETYMLFLHINENYLSGTHTRTASSITGICYGAGTPYEKEIVIPTSLYDYLPSNEKSYPALFTMTETKEGQSEQPFGSVQKDIHAIDEEIKPTITAVPHTFLDDTDTLLGTSDFFFESFSQMQFIPTVNYKYGATLNKITYAIGSGGSYQQTEHSYVNLTANTDTFYFRVEDSRGLISELFEVNLGMINWRLPRLMAFEQGKMMELIIEPFTEEEVWGYFNTIVVNSGFGNPEYTGSFQNVLTIVYTIYDEDDNVVDQKTKTAIMRADTSTTVNLSQAVAVSNLSADEHYRIEFQYYDTLSQLLPDGVVTIRDAIIVPTTIFDIGKDSINLNCKATFYTNQASIGVNSNGELSATTKGGSNLLAFPFIEKIWENQAPTSTMAANTVINENTAGWVSGKSLADYPMILIVQKNQNTIDIFTTGLFLVDGTQQTVTGSNCSGSTAYYYKRGYTVETTGITCTTGYRAGTANVQYAIPVEIYGIRGIN